ncbi:hypothetical protein FE782_27630 [Paenibacillus antri]|uniref:Uncharacterized protein n=1 Tax=Paenibacillus antri TaxID=2582848 RepID=A0A5R9G6B3_9BACL|nr:hypothetical protein [Paenibacillus antri]TLS49048.1 hypothetical protein FE782_27630 [Paenibacillus antri]
MPNYIPYLALSAVSVAALAVLLVRKRAFWPLILVLAFSGMIYFLEFFTFVLYGSYRYFPHLVGKPYYDNTFGAVISNLIAVPVAAVYVAVYRLGARWWILLALGFGGIEWLFRWLEVYNLHWWKIPYTIAALIFFFWLSRLWLEKVRQGASPYVFLTLHMFAWSAIGTFAFVLAVAGVRAFHTGVFEDPYRDDIFMSAIYGFAKATLLAAVVYRTRSLGWCAVALLLIFAANAAMMRFDTLRVYLPLWQYWLIYVPSMVAVLWLMIVALRTMKRLRFSSFR